MLLELLYAIRFAFSLFFMATVVLAVSLILAFICPIIAIILMFIHTKGEKNVRG